MHRHGRLMGKRGVGMRKGLYTAITALFAVLLLTGCGGEQAEPLDLRAEYAIDAVLEPEAERLAFTQSVTVRNGGDNATEELWFQLRANRFAAEDAKLTVSSVTGADGEPLEYELSGYDQLCRVALPAPLEGGGTATVNFTCELGIPECARLLGTDRYGQIHLPYFYAQLAVCDENGWDRSFWNPDNAETDGRYAVPADFRLAVTAPESYALASNGELVSRETGGGLTRWAFEAENRREIMLTASENYVLRESDAGDVHITALFDSTVNTPEEMDAAVEAAEFGLEYFEGAFGPYPYDELVMSTGAVPSTGMPASLESSGMFTIQLERGTNYTLYHELAHQWFYCLVGNSEVTDCWLDEAFATWAAYLCMEAAGEDADTRWELCEMDAENIAGRGYRYINVPLDGADTFKIVFYERGAMFLRELEEAVGRDEFLNFVRGYCEEFAFENVSTADFAEYLSDNMPADVSGIVAEYIEL